MLPGSVTLLLEQDLLHMKKAGKNFYLGGVTHVGLNDNSPDIGPGSSVPITPFP